ncbi:MAG TPA: DHA2 family efflux MFS transporter permease subunit [Chloroflexota bacterium]|nr:DHA2 family efflux MFS transporter permease subunit [Chloroflexota bacterium]
MAEAVVPATLESDSLIKKPPISVSPWLVLAVILFGEYMIVLDTTIVNVAIPDLSQQLNASLDQILWVVNAYLLTFAVLLIPAGRLGDVIGPKKMYLAGMAIFTFSSLACGLAQNPTELILFRVCQAVGGAALTPQPGPILTATFSQEQRGNAFGFFGAVIGLGAVSGPTLGGFLTSTFSWRAVFFPNVPIGIGAMLVALLVMPELRTERRTRLDLMGGVIVAVGLLTGVWALIEGQRYVWGPILKIAEYTLGPLHLSLVSIPSLLILCFVLLAVFVIWERRQKEPMLPLSLIADRNFGLGSILAATVTFCMLGLFLVFLIYLQDVLGLSALQAGLTVLPNAVALAASSVATSRLMKWIEPKYLPLLGLLIYTGGAFLLIQRISLQAQSLDFTVPLLLTGTGLGMTITATVTLAMHRVAVTAAGAASGFLNTTRQAGMVLGAAIVGALLQSHLTGALHDKAQQFSSRLPGPLRHAFVHAFTFKAGHTINLASGKTHFPLPHGIPPEFGPEIQSLSSKVFEHAFIAALKPSLVAPIAIALASAVAVLLVRPIGAVRSDGEVVEAEPESRATGAPIAVSDGFVHPAVQAARTVRLQSFSDTYPAYLILSDRPDPVPLRSGMTLGRATDNDVILDDSEVSRHHAAIDMQGMRISVRDLNSRNGTVVNGRPIHEPTILHDMDTVILGETAVRLRIDFERARPRLIRAQDGMEFPVVHRLLIGRAPDNDIAVIDPAASRRHAEVRVEGGVVVLHDLESLNGTRVNGNLASGLCPLQSGDTVEIGDTKFSYCDDLEKSA